MSTHVYPCLTMSYHVLPCLSWEDMGRHGGKSDRFWREKKDNPPRINRAQDTYLSNCRKKDKAREERKRIEKEQAYTSMLVLGMIGIRWKKTTKRNGSKNRLDWTGKESKRLKNVPQNGRRFDRCPPLAFHPVQCASVNQQVEVLHFMGGENSPRRVLCPWRVHRLAWPAPCRPLLERRPGSWGESAGEGRGRVVPGPWQGPSRTSAASLARERKHKQERPKKIKRKKKDNQQIHAVQM
jgi:hypothetical protein